jgi:PAT family beta-lactamase induction signal transducer AmpG
VRTRATLAWVSLLYVGEGLPAAVVHEVLPVWLRAEGLSLTALGLASLISLPWSLKPLWAPAVDRVGRPGAWAAAGMALVAAALLALPWAPPAARWGLLLLVALGGATHDVAADGWTAAVPASLAGRVNGVRVAAYRAAALGLGGGALLLAAVVPWAALLAGCGAVAAALALAEWRLPGGAAPAAPLGDWARALWAWARQDGAARGLGLLVLILGFKLGDAAMGPMVKPFWLDSGRSPAEIGLVSTTLGAALTVAGALIGGELVTRAGLGRALVIGGVAQGITNLGYAAAALAPGRAAVIAASLAESLGAGLGTAAFLALLTRLCAGAQAATRFALLTSLGLLTRNLAGALSGWGAEDLGYAAWFAITGLAGLPALALVPLATRRTGPG